MRIVRLAAITVMSTFVLAACFGPVTPTAEVGECFQVSDLGDEISELPTVACDEPHEAEVYHVFDIESEAAFDFNTVVGIAEETCIAEFDDFVGFHYWDSELDVYFLHPIAEGWEAGDREVLCAVIAPDWESAGLELTMVTGSLEGAGR